MDERVIWDNPKTSSHAVRFTVERMRSGNFIVRFYAAGFYYSVISRKIRPAYYDGLRRYLNYIG